MMDDKAYNQRLQSLNEDMQRASITGDVDLHNRSKLEFYNLVAQKAKKEDDKIMLYLLVLVEECEKKGMFGSASVLNAFMLFHRIGQLDRICGEFLRPFAKEMSLSIVQLAQEEVARRQMEEN